MFTDPLNLPTIDVSGAIVFGTEVPLALLPGDVRGRSVRTGTLAGFPAELSLTKTTTRENKPYGTDRNVIRLQVVDLDADGNPVVAFAQLTIGYPKAQIAQATVLSLVRHVSTLALFGPDPVSSTTTWTTGGAPFLVRVALGEG